MTLALWEFNWDSWASTLAGTATTTFAQTGGLNAGTAASGTATVTFSQTGGLLSSTVMVGTSVLTFNQTGVLKSSGIFAGVVAVTFSQTGLLAPVFPTQYLGLKYYDGSVVNLCLVATADAPAGDQIRINKNGTTYAVYLVDTTDPNASKVRVNTSDGVKSLRLKT